MTKVFTKSEWIKLLKRNLNPYPRHNREHRDEYITPEHLIVTIFTKAKKYTLKYTFGGPIYTATINLSDKKEIKVEFPIPMFPDGRGKKPYKIRWERVEGITFDYFNVYRRNQ